MLGFDQSIVNLSNLKILGSPPGMMCVLFIYKKVMVLHGHCFVLIPYAAKAAQE